MSRNIDRILVLALITMFAVGCQSSDKNITAFAFTAADNPGLPADLPATITGTNITATVPFGTDIAQLVATFTTTGNHVDVGGVTQVSGTTANSFASPVIYGAVADDGSTQDYTVTVTVAPSTAKEITAYAFLAANNPSLSADVAATITGTSISATVPFGTDATTLVATFTTTGANVAVGNAGQTSGKTANNFTNPVVYVVTAADGSTRSYAVTVAIATSTAKEITAYGFLAADNAGLSADVAATITGTTIAATVPFGTDVTNLVATFATTGASVAVDTTQQVSGATANDFTNPVIYVVTAADGSTRSYTVTVTVAPSPAKDITAFAFLSVDNPGLSADVAATINGTTIAATMPFGTDATNLIASFATTGASVAVGGTQQVSGTTANDFTNPVAYVVTAADGTTNTYTVIVTIAPGPAKDITAFAFLSVDNAGLSADVLATINGTAIAATVPFGTDVTGLVATFATTGAGVAVAGTAQVSGITANDFTSPVSYVVTAGDGSTKTYTMTVTIAPSPAKDITSFAFLSARNSGLSADVIATITGTDITATVPFGTNVGALVATFSTTGASVSVGGNPQTSGITANNFTTQVVYMVTAADGSMQQYTVSVAIAPSPAKDLTSFAFLSVDNSGLPANVIATITGTTITATVPLGTNVTGLVATFATTGASVSVNGALEASGITPNDFTAPVDYRVTAADGSTQDYTVTVTAM